MFIDVKSKYQHKYSMFNIACQVVEEISQVEFSIAMMGNFFFSRVFGCMNIFFFIVMMKVLEFENSKFVWLFDEIWGSGD